MAVPGRSRLPHRPSKTWKCVDGVCSAVYAVVLLLTLVHHDAALVVDPSMRSFGTAIKSGSCKAGQEKVVFEHAVGGSGSSPNHHGVITQMWHGGTRGDPRMRVYVDGEVGGPTAAVDYVVSLAHGLSAANPAVFPWQSERFGHTHTMGWYSMWPIPFEQKIRVTLTCSVDSPFWFRVAGAENFPVALGNIELPSHAKLRVARYNATVEMGTLVTLANVTGTAGLLTQTNLRVSSVKPYQEGCVQSTVDGRKLWLSSGLEDYFMGSYFHTMPNFSLPVVGFQLDDEARCPTKGNGPNALSAYRIHTADPVLFGDSLLFQWQATGQHNVDMCNYDWPPSGQPGTSAGRDGRPAETGTVSIEAYSWIYVY